MAASDEFYQEILVEVNAVIDELGTEFNIRGDGAYDSDTLTTGAPTSRSVVGVVVDNTQATAIAGSFNVSEAEALSWIGKKMLLLKASASPQPKEEIEVDSRWYPLDQVVEIKPADISLLFMLDVSR